MSGIFGVFGYGAAQDVNDIRMAALERALKHRGPDGISTRQSGSLALGHCLLDVARNGMDEDDRYIVSFDGRLDNRTEICASLGISVAPPGDANLVLKAYEKWGEHCANHLLGDFSFALFDRSNGRLYCARDHFGIRPLFYSSAKDCFVFASEAQALLVAMPDTQKRVDEEYLADYLAGHAPASDATLFPSVKRLPPGHYCIVEEGRPRLHCYYSLELGSVIERANAPEQLARIFEEAVRCRLPVYRRVGALLSGGLDSSSIAAVAASLLKAEGKPSLPTFSMVFPSNPELDESVYIQCVTALGHMEPTLFDPSNVAPYGRFDRLLSINTHPPLGLNLQTTSALYDIAAEQGIGVLLDGHAGDEALYYGALRMADLAYSGAWWRLWCEIRMLAPNYHLEPVRYFIKSIWSCGPQRKIRRWMGDVKRKMRPSLPFVRGLKYLSPEFANSTKIISRRAEALIDPAYFGKEERLIHHRYVSSDLQSYAHESLDLVASHAGVEMRFPFLDKRLIEFSLSLPSREKMGLGYTRLILRRAMEGRLPPGVRLRTSKVNFLPHIERGLLHHSHELVDRLLADAGGNLRRYVDLDLFQEYWCSVKGGAPLAGFDMQALARVVAFALWLETPAASPFLKGA